MNPWEEDYSGTKSSAMPWDEDYSSPNKTAAPAQPKAKKKNILSAVGDLFAPSINRAYENELRATAQAAEADNDPFLKRTGKQAWEGAKLGVQQAGEGVNLAFAPLAPAVGAAVTPIMKKIVEDPGFGKLDSEEPFYPEPKPQMTTFGAAPSTGAMRNVNKGIGSVIKPVAKVVAEDPELAATAAGVANILGSIAGAGAGKVSGLNPDIGAALKGVKESVTGTSLSDLLKATAQPAATAKKFTPKPSTMVPQVSVPKTMPAPVPIEKLTPRDIESMRGLPIESRTGAVTIAPTKAEIGMPLIKDISPGEYTVMAAKKAPETVPFSEYVKAQKQKDINPIPENPTAVELAQHNAGRAFQWIGDQKKQAGARISEAIAAVPDATINISDFKVKFASEVDRIIGGLTEGAIPTSDTELRMAQDIANRLYSDVPDVVSVADAQRLKQNLRSGIKYDVNGQRRMDTGRLEAILKSSTNDLDKQLDAAVPGYKEANEDFARYTEAEDVLSSALGGEIRYEGEILSYKMGNSMMKRGLESLANSGISPIFSIVKQATGGQFDLFQDALYASIAQRLSTDPRYREQVARFGKIAAGMGMPVQGVAADATLGLAAKMRRGGAADRLVEWYNKQQAKYAGGEVPPLQARELFKASGEGAEVPGSIAEMMQQGRGGRGRFLGSERGAVGSNPQVKTPEFKNWFGDWEKNQKGPLDWMTDDTQSKVVDDIGRPLIVYRGDKEAFSTFDQKKSGKRAAEYDKPVEGSHFFTNKPKLANSYANQHTDFAGNIKYRDGGNVKAVYLDLKKPLEIYTDGSRWDDILYRGESYSTNGLTRIAKNGGYDGLILRDVADQGEGLETFGDIYVPFSPTQIKSATGNSGVFNPANPDIRGNVSGTQLLTGMAGGGVGGSVAGAQIGDTPEERQRNMLIGAAFGTVGGGLLPMAATKTAEVVKQVATTSGVGLTDIVNSAEVGSVGTWRNSGRSAFKEAVSKTLSVPKQLVDRYIKQVDNVAAKIVNSPSLDYEESDLASALYSSMKGNRDPLYKFSLDFSTLCKKRAEMQATMEAAQRAKGRMLTANEFMSLRGMMKDAGLEVSCGPCYVESRRMFAGERSAKVIAKHPEVPRELFLDQNGIDVIARDYPEAYKSLKEAWGAAGIKMQESRVAYNSEILEYFNHENPRVKQSRVDKTNQRSGLRWQSWSDFELPHLIDGMQAVGDMSTVDLMGHTYTKVPEFVEAFGNTGLMINMSLIPKGSGLANGRLLFDAVEGMDFNVARGLRQKFDKTAGTVSIGVGDDQIRALLASPEIDYVIPYHHSGLGKQRRVQMPEVAEWKDYTADQSEKIFDAARNKAAGGKKKVDWSEHEGDTQTYFALCDERGLTPKFSQFRGEENYWKLLIDRRMVDGTGNRIAQQPVRPIFDTRTINRMLNEYQAPKVGPAQDIVDAFLALGDNPADEKLTKMLKILGNKKPSRGARSGFQATPFQNVTDNQALDALTRTGIGAGAGAVAGAAQNDGSEQSVSDMLLKIAGGALAGFGAPGLVRMAKSGFKEGPFSARTGVVPLDIAKQIDMPVSAIKNPDVLDAISNTPGAKITGEGLELDVSRFQKPEQAGSESVRTGVFYFPEQNPKNKSAYTRPSNAYGGKQEITGRTLYKNPIIVKAGTGGRAPELAYDAIKGKGAYQAMRGDILSTGSYYTPRTAEDVYRVLEKYGADPDLAWEIVDNSKGGNLLPYAIQENIVAHAVREAGYDAVLGYSKGKARGNFLSEVFDVRELDYPTPEGDYRLNDSFTRILSQMAGKSEQQ